jgi:hypothetical protein
MNRTLKQVLYGLLYAVLWAGIIYGVYRLTLKPPASCSDGILNRDETEIDCGGQFCDTCEIKKLSPIELSSVQLLPSTTEDNLNAIVTMRNPNPLYGARSFIFDIFIFGTSTSPVYTERIQLPVYPSEEKYRLFINVPVAYSSGLRAAATSTEVIWVPLIDLARPKTPVREVRTIIDTGGKRAIMTGVIQNDNAFALRRITINGVATAGAEIVGVSKTVIQDVLPKEDRFFQILIPFFGADGDTQKVEAKVSVEAERN